MKRIKLITLLLLSAFISNAAIINVANPGNGTDIYTNLLAAFNAAATKGDVIVVPAGNWFMTGNITTTKMVSLRGAGIGVSTIIRSESSSDANLESWFSMITWNINSDKNSGIDISGITFKSKIPSLIGTTTTSPPIAPSDGYSLAGDAGVKIVSAINFRIHHCRFENFGAGATYIVHRNYIASGLIDHNEYYHNAKGKDGLGLGYGCVVYGDDTQWLPTVVMGSSNFIFIEDNTFDYHRHSCAGAKGDLRVFRYNTVRFNIISPNQSHAVDMHEDGGSNAYGSRALDAYHNRIINSTMTDGIRPMYNGSNSDSVEERAIGITNGYACIHNNYVSGFRFAVGIVSPSAHSSGVYPYRHQPGAESGRRYGASHTGTRKGKEGAGDLFEWTDTLQIWTLSNGGYCQKFWNYESTVYGGYVGDMFSDDRDFHRDTPEPGHKDYTYPHPLQSRPVQ
jgi:hypothetical protein